MKLFIIFLTIFLAITQATNLSADYELQLNDIIYEAEQFGKNVAKELKQQYSQILLDPLQQVDEALQTIEGRKVENEVCVKEQQEVINLAIEMLYDDISICGITAAKTSTKIAIDVNTATKQIVYDGLSVLSTYQKCKKYKNSILQKTCYARLTIKATLYLKNARKSIKVIKESTNERIPAVFIDINACTHSASEKTLIQLDYINSKIDVCVGGK